MPYPPADASAGGFFGPRQRGVGRCSQVTGRGEKLSREEEQAVLALLTRPTVAEAAQARAVSEVTLWRWMQRPNFGDR